MTIIEVTQGSEGGSVSIADNQIVYTPTTDFTGKDTFTYTISDGNGGTSTASVSVTVNTSGTGSTNNAPSAFDDVETTDMGTAVTVNVTGNDIDPDGDMIMIKSFNQAVNGTVTEGAGGQLIYTPNAGFSGSDSFTYVIEDLAGLTSEATVFITVNEAATVNIDPTATDDSGETLSGKSVHINVLENDSDSDGGTISIDSFTQGAYGSVTQSATGELTYTANTGYVGKDQFTYTIIDGQGGSSTATVYIDVKSATDDGTGTGCSVVCTKVKADDHLMDANTTATIDVLANDDGSNLNIITVSQGANGTVSISGNKVTYTPNKDYVGDDVFWYEVQDATGYKDSNMVMVYVEATK
ncbi:Ig-like domain-containing protein [Leucothrix pacifica]|uniref:Tandem-95 repeat protein n=1 Tax=Leucothrix pacifica TaxID=1247513 RepID=A0A317CV06_9GAMM|nr:Ig-like domain-containing protein [Leucothrix pacifica]PWR00173.1 hypothetical protein DKW60_03275 [Leucothrix pacifica]